MGPHVRSDSSSADVGGGVRAPVRRAGPGELSVGGLRWFLAEADCFEALDHPVWGPLPDNEATAVEEQPLAAGRGGSVP